MKFQDLFSLKNRKKKKKKKLSSAAVVIGALRVKRLMPIFGPVGWVDYLYRIRTMSSYYNIT